MAYVRRDELPRFRRVYAASMAECRVATGTPSGVALDEERLFLVLWSGPHCEPFSLSAALRNPIEWIRICGPSRPLGRTSRHGPTTSTRILACITAYYILLIEFTAVRFVPENGQGGQCSPSISRFPNSST